MSPKAQVPDSIDWKTSIMNTLRFAQVRINFRKTISLWGRTIASDPGPQHLTCKADHLQYKVLVFQRANYPHNLADREQQTLSSLQRLSSPSILARGKEALYPPVGVCYGSMQYRTRQSSQADGVPGRVWTLTRSLYRCMTLVAVSYICVYCMHTFDLLTSKAVYHDKGGGHRYGM